MSFQPTAENALWRGLRDSARQQVTVRDYSVPPSSPAGISDAGILARLDPDDPAVAREWIPGVEIFERKVFSQRFRGAFSELARQTTGPCARIGFWPKQWAVARMYAGTAKGFHIHPPRVPDDEEPAAWFQRQFPAPPAVPDCAARTYDLEQWDMMFLVAGSAEMILIDERAGLERRKLQFFIESRLNRQGESIGVIIPPGVAHALRTESSDDVIMVYGTSTVFEPAAEGRLESGVETADLPADWKRYLNLDRLG